MKESDFREHIDRLKVACRGQDIAASLGLPGRGRRFFCPECQPAGGKTPDLEVFDNGFKCYKCGRKGDVIDLVVLADGISKAAAIKYLEQLAGIDRPLKSPGYPIGRSEIGRPPRSEAAKSNRKAAKQAELTTEARSDMYDAFLKTVCRSIYGTPGAEYLTSRGIDAETAEKCGVRYCQDLSGLWTLADREDIKAAGLATLYVFQKADLGFLAFPYIRAGRPVFIKARCLLSKDEAGRRGITRFMNTGGRVPCLWNHDAIEGAARVLICEGEIDALTAVQAGEVGVGLPGWGHFKDAWIVGFRGKAVVLVMDADEAGQKGSRDIARRFIGAGFPAPRQLVLDKGRDLNELFLLKRKNTEHAL